MVKKDALEILAQKKWATTKVFLKTLKNKRPVDIDKVFHRIHNEVFEKINCLECGNCCASISPVLNNADVNRLVDAAHMKRPDFMGRYLHVDEDEDYVFSQTPCPFLQPDCQCTMYDYRPRACREYPHTNRENVRGIVPLIEKNYFICPAVFEIVERAKKEIKH